MLRFPAMSTTDPATSLGVEEAREFIARTSFPDLPGSPALGRVGMEPEYLVLRADEERGIIERPRLEGMGGVLAALACYPGPVENLRLLTSGPPPVYGLRNGGRITFEPGAQIEHSSAVHDTAAQAMDDVEQTVGELVRAFTGMKALLVSVGLDGWTDRSKVEQQLRAPRYRSMAAYFDERSAYGRVMMRHTASLQVNLDLGPREVGLERWRLSNLLSPIATASFACSPEDGWQSARARAWQGLDPTRTGFPKGLLAGGEVDPGEVYADLVLDADVLLFRFDGPDGVASDAEPGEPGFSFRNWIEDGHPRHGHPTLPDLEYHLTTVFPETRVRGFLEMRCSDALPARWKAAGLVFWIGLLYDEQARAAALSHLEPTLPELAERWVESARLGFAAPGIGEDAKVIWDEALAGARRLPDGYVRAIDLATAEAFAERFVAQGRTPAQELAELLASDPLEALVWGSEGA